MPLNAKWTSHGLLGTKLLTFLQIDNTTPTPLTHGMLWNKNQAHSPEVVHGLIQPIQNIDHVFHGHTIINKITTVSNRTFMDLGSYESGLIGLINPIEFLRDK